MGGFLAGSVNRSVSVSQLKFEGTSTRSQVNKIKFAAGLMNMESKSSMSSATSVLQVKIPKNSPL